MQYIDASKMLFYQERFIERKKPITAEMMLTNFCNYDCPYCRYKHGEGYFHYEDFVKAVRILQGLGVRGFILTGGGEPLLNPEIKEIVGWLDSEGVPYGINTNFSKYVKCNPKWLKVSLHAGVDLSPVLENIKRFRRENRSTVLGVQVIITRHEEVREKYFQFKELDVDYISFRPIESVERLYSEEEVRKIIAELEAINDKKVLINYKWYMMNERFDRCYANWAVITVDWSGNVWYCCHKSEEVVGNIFLDNVVELKAKHVTDMGKCEVPCRQTANNIIVRDYKLGVHIEFI